MRIPDRISAVILDMDGILHDTEAVYHAALKHAVETVGFEVGDAFCHSLIGIPGPESDEMLRMHLGSDFPYATYKVVYERFRDRALESSVPLKPGAAELIELLNRRGLKAAIATSASRRSAENHLSRSGLRRHFPIVVTRDDVARGKPHPDLFLRAAELLHTDPCSCLAVEDSLNGIRAAHAAGMIPIMVPDLLEPTDELRTVCFRVALDLHEVCAVLLNQLDG